VIVRDLVVIEYVSVDGVIQAPGHAAEDRAGGFEHGGWTGPFMDDHGRYMRAAFRGAGAVLLGRLTYEIWASYWPTVTDPSDEIAEALNRLPKYVASTTLGEPPWHPTTVLSGDVASQVARLKEVPDRDIVLMGSAQLAQTLANHDLVDRYELWVHPVVLGAGKRLFPGDGPARELRLVDSRTTAGGLVLMTYERTQR
jgi:dihydrofolate reductase